jgi:hypothetical protein
MASFHLATVEEFLAQSDEYVLARLETAYARRGYTSQYSDQTLTWERDLGSLRTTLKECVAASTVAGAWGLILEFSIPKKELRIDIVLLVSGTIVIVEGKTGVAGVETPR